ncbi:MAG: UDP-N-acetylmuramate--L-alanine ligase [Chloroflexi bacterium]|nr:UDP-N-acetylmuramate--L-alanine ligase [Chloroflexota bacterium]
MSDISGPVHLIGVGGIHMSAIALLLLEKGVAVTGSDLRRSELTEKVERAGGRVAEGHSATNLGNPALVVTTAAANDENPEIVEARRRGIPVILRAEMVARLMEGKRVIAVTGAHGKTTTSSLIAFILRKAGRNPMYLLGGESIDLDGHAAWGGGDVCVVEADEYKRAFHEYRPQVAVITNVEPDHLDYYGTEAAYHEAFAHFASLVQPGGLLLVCADDPGSARLNKAAKSARNQTYGTTGGSDWAATVIEKDARGATFIVSAAEDVLGELRVPFPGDHFIRNALAATAVCLQEGVNLDTIRGALAKVHGAHRRFETVGEAHGILVMDDYAHHPTEVRSTIATARAAFPERRLIVVYQPHTYTRIAYLWDEWTRCWDGIEELIVLETYAARETPLEGKSAKDLADAITGPSARYARTFDDAAGQAVALAHPGDVIFTMGAGDVIEVGPKILERLS